MHPSSNIQISKSKKLRASWYSLVAVSYFGFLLVTLAMPFYLIGPENPDFFGYKDIYENKGAWLVERSKWSLFLYLTNTHSSYFSNYLMFRYHVVTALTISTLLIFIYIACRRHIPLFLAGLMLMSIFLLRNTVLMREAMSFACLLFALIFWFQGRPYFIARPMAFLMLIFAATLHIGGALALLVVVLKKFVKIRLSITSILGVLIASFVIIYFQQDLVASFAALHDREEAIKGWTVNRAFLWLFNLGLALSLFSALNKILIGRDLSLVSAGFIMVIFPALFFSFALRTFEAPNVLIVSFIRSFDLFVHLGAFIVSLKGSLRSKSELLFIGLLFLRALSEYRWL